jgi:hypothetical protein
MGNLAQVDTSRKTFVGSGGKWATERLLNALRESRQMSPAELRDCDTLRKDEWIEFDEVLVQEGVIRLRGIADLIANGLVRPVTNALGKTIFQWEDVSDMDPAIVSLDGLARSDNDAQVFSLNSIPLPIIHKDFDISLRTLSASRERGEALDTTQARVSGRLCMEELEKIYFQGGPTFGGLTIYGLTTHPNRNTGGFSVATWTAAGATGPVILDDVTTMKQALIDDRFYGPYALYVPSAYDTKLDKDYNVATSTTDTIRDRLLRVDGLTSIQVVDQMPADNVVMVQLTEDVVSFIDGESIQTVMWDLYGGFSIAFKAFLIQTPLVRATKALRSGVFHMS